MCHSLHAGYCCILFVFSLVNLDKNISVLIKTSAKNYVRIHQWRRTPKKSGPTLKVIAITGKVIVPTDT